MPIVRMEAIIPKTLFKLPLVRAELLQEMGRQLKIIDGMYGATYKTWNHQPKFTKKFSSNRNRIVGQVTTIDVIYSWVEDGTRRHIILPRSPSGVLAFPSTQRAKTKPKTIGSGGGFKSSATSFRRFAVHPGIKPRKFTEEIVKRRKDFYTPQMQKAVARGVKRRA